MGKSKVFYDVASLILVILAVIALITVFSGPTYASTEESANLMISSMISSMIWFVLFYTYSLLFSIFLIVLVAKKEKKIGNAIVMILGCLILPGILPLFYYFFSLRKKL